MNPAYLGDSYDLVKRFFCTELAALGYSINVNPMFTGAWNGTEHEFYRLIGVARFGQQEQGSTRTAAFFDPDTGIRPCYARRQPGVSATSVRPQREMYESRS